MRKWITMLVAVGMVAAMGVAYAEPVEPNAEAAEAYNAYVEAYKAKDMTTAATKLKAAIAAQPDWAQPYLALGELYKGQKKYADAATQIAKATELTPDDAKAFLDLGTIYVLQDLNTKSIPALQKALSLDPSLVEAHKLMATAYFTEGDYAKAADEYVLYTDKVKSDAVAFFKLAEANKKLKKNSAAVTAYKAAVKADASFAEAYYNLGNLHLAREDYSEAEEAFTKVTEIEPNNFKAQFNLAISIHYQGRLKDALAAYEKTVKVGGNKSAAKSTVAQAQATIKGLKEQIAAGE